MPQEGTIQSVERSFALLELLVSKADGANVKELADGMGLAKSTVHRILQNLVLLGYVSQNPATQKYRATLRMYEMGSHVVAHTDVVSIARAHLDALSAEVGEAVHLVVQDGVDIVYVYKADAGASRMASRVGLRRPMYCTGVGKAIMATLPYRQVEEIWAGSEIVALTPKTITEFSVLEKRLAKIRRNGWATDDEENELGIRCVALALPGTDGTAAAAFSVTSLVAQMDEARMDALVERCLEVRRAICAEMGLGGRGL